VTGHRDPDRKLIAYFADGMDVLPDRVVDAVLDEVHHTRQRAGFGPWRTRRMSTFSKLVLAAATVVVIAVAGFNLVPKPIGGIGGQGTTPSPVVTSSPTPQSSPSPSPQAIRLTVAGTDTGGAADPLQLTATVPGTWEVNPYATNNAATGADGAAMFATVLTTTFPDPCSHVPRSPNVRTVAEAATALGELGGVTTTTPVQAQIAGRDATLVELTMPASMPCAPDQFYLWTDDPAVEGGWWALAPSETIRVWVLDVGGKVVTIAARTYPGTTDATKADLQAALDSLAFDTTP
jgi:hypothetical protein